VVALIDCKNVNQAPLDLFPEDINPGLTLRRSGPLFANVGLTLRSKRAEEMSPKDFAVVLQRAATAVGGIDALRSQLGVPLSALRRWMDGSSAAPTHVFLRAVDILTAHVERGRFEINRATTDRVRAEHERIVRDTHVIGKRLTDTLAQSLEIRRESLAILQEALRLRARRYVSVNEPPRLPSHQPLVILDPAFLPGDMSALLAATLKAALIAAETDLGNIQLRDTDGSLYIAAQRGFESSFLDFFAKVKGDESACGMAMNQQKQVVIADVRTHPLFAGMPAGQAMLEAGSRAVASTPLIDETSGMLMGMVSTHHRAIGPRADDELALLGVVAKRAASWLEPVLS
jgi:hypothetical protein